MNGKFIVVEGLEGAGKTSAISEIIKFLYSYGIKDVFSTREPGSTPISEVLRTIIKYSIDNEIINHYAELLMLYAARVQLVERIIKPALARGTWIVGDRHDLSSQAYQGGGRGIDLYFLKTLRNSVLGKFYPDLTLYLDIPPLIGLSRTRKRSELDRIELESVAFFDRTRACYQTLASMDKSIVTIDASQPLVMVNIAIRTQLINWLKNTG